MRKVAGTLERLARAGLLRLDAAMNRLYGSRYNPVYHSGSVVVALLLVLLLTGLYLLLFYRVGSPYASVARISEQAWLGQWIRSLHRYASGAAVVAIAIHALRMFAQGRSWGARALAWVSGVVLLLVFLVAGWTGYVMVWDIQGQVLAIEGARLLDLLPIFSEPISRTFVGEQPMQSAFFFVNLFLHVALPIGLLLLLWLHVSRVARPVLLPPRRLMWGIIALLFAVSVLWPIGMAPEADLFRLPERAPFDLFYSFWLPFAQALPVGVVWAVIVLLTLPLLLVPLWARRPPPARPAPSVVNERLCTGCEQCVLDCPYEAISMIPRADGSGGKGRSALVARVDPALCVSCGICAGSCAPMGVGPPGRTGRDQLAALREMGDLRLAGAAETVVLIACERGAGGVTGLEAVEGARVLPVRCVGSLHTSVIEYLVRGGARGVMVAGCPPRDCWNREGMKWLEQRMYHEREAELQERVDRRRVRLVHASALELAPVLAELRAFRAELAALDVQAEEEIDLIALCDRAAEEVQP